MASVLRQTGAVEVQVVGAGALNQAVKAMAIARGFVVASGIDLICVPNFADIEIDGQSRTALRLLVEHRGGAGQVAPAGEDGEALAVGHDTE
jgi:stage V sporulation protein S